MAIIQISKIQVRSGNLVDLPQLDDAEFGWASDQKKLYIGKTTPNENIEILTSYSNIYFSQVNGSYGNLNVTSPVTGQTLTYDATSNAWINTGGNASEPGNSSYYSDTPIHLGNVSNVYIGGGAIGYVLETDGTGNLSWTPKGTISANISGATKANPVVITTSSNNFFTDGARVTITNVSGMTQLNGNSYYANVLTANTFSLYSDSGLTTPVNGTGYGTYTGNGRAIASVGGSGSGSAAGGSTYSVQYNSGGIATGDANFLWNYTSQLLTLTGTANISQNLNITGNVTASRLVSNIATGTAPLTVTSTTRVANLNVATSGVANTVNDAAQPNITSTGTLASLSVSGNANIGNIGTAGLITATGNLNAGNVITSGLVSATGNITGANLNATTLVSAPQVSANSNGLGTNFKVGDDAYIGDINVTNTVVLKGQQDAANGYIIFGNGDTTSTLGRAGTGPLTYNGAFSVVGNANIGNIGTAGLITATGNLNAGNIITAGVMSSTGNATHGNISTGGLITATGNVTAGNLITGGIVSATGNANVGNLGTAGLITATGNLNAGNIITAGVVSATGNGTFGNVSATAHTGTTVSISGNANVGNLGTGGLVTATGNITGGNIITGGVVTATGNGTFGNIITAGTLSVTANANIGNIGTAGLITATGNITGGNLSGTLVTGTLTTAAQPNVTSVSTSFTNLTFANAQTITGNNMTLSTGANTNAGTITGNWTLSTGSRMQATYADLAEYYEADQGYEPGTVLEFGGEKEVTIAEDGTTRVAGVVSTDPAYAMNAKCPGIAVAIALQGRVPTKVRGTVRKGDMMVSAGNGFARPSNSPTMGTVIGKALENFDGIEGVIEIAVGRL